MLAGVAWALTWSIMASDQSLTAAFSWALREWLRPAAKAASPAAVHKQIAFYDAAVFDLGAAGQVGSLDNGRYRGEVIGSGNQFGSHLGAILPQKPLTER